MIWSRPSSALPFCAVARIDASVHTLCGGRWDARDPREERSEEPADACGACKRIAGAREAARVVGGMLDGPGLIATLTEMASTRARPIVDPTPSDRADHPGDGPQGVSSARTTGEKPGDGEDG